VDVALAVEDAERLGQVLVEIEILGSIEMDLCDLRLLDPVHFPVPDLPVVGGEADQVQRPRWYAKPYG